MTVGGASGTWGGSIGWRLTEPIMTHRRESSEPAVSDAGPERQTRGGGSANRVGRSRSPFAIASFLYAVRRMSAGICR